MADAVLVAERRTAAGKRPAGRVRREGLVPAVVYGLGAENVAVSVRARELANLLAGEAGSNTLFTLKIDGSDQLAIARQIQRHPLKGTLLHVDFVRVRADQTIQADIPVRLVGQSEGVALGGVLEQLVHTVSIEAKPADVPNALEIDITALEIGEAVHVNRIVIPTGVVLLTDPDDMVAQITAPRVADEPTTVEGGGEAVEGAEGVAAPAAGEGGESSDSE